MKLTLEMCLKHSNHLTVLLWRLRGRQGPRPPLTYKQYEDEAELIQVEVWVREGVTERGVDDHEEHAAADSTKRRFLSFKPILDVSSDDLQHREQQVASFQRCRESNGASQSDSDSRKT